MNPRFHLELRGARCECVIRSKWLASRVQAVPVKLTRKRERPSAFRVSCLNVEAQRVRLVLSPYPVAVHVILHVSHLISADTTDCVHDPIHPPAAGSYLAGGPLSIRPQPVIVWCKRLQNFGADGFPICQRTTGNPSQLTTDAKLSHAGSTRRPESDQGHSARRATRP